MSEDDESSLSPTRADYVHTAFTAALAAAPIVGGPLATIFSKVKPSPLEKRHDKFLHLVNQRLKAIEEKVKRLDYESLARNETFITVLLQAWLVAIRNHQEEKIEALCNTVINTALTNDPDDDEILMFLSYVDTMTQWHLRILNFFDNPRQCGKKHNISYPNWSSGGVSNVLECTFPELEEKREFYSQIVSELYSRGLLNLAPGSLNVNMTADGMFASRTTQRG